MRPNPEFLSVMHANYPPGTKLLMGCQMGGRSAQAAQILAAAGYQDVSNVRGGYGGARDRSTGQLISEGWVEAELPWSRVPPRLRRTRTCRRRPRRIPLPPDPRLLGRPEIDQCERVSSPSD